MVDENAGELVTNGAVDERGGDAGIHAAGQAEDDFFVADLFADAGDGFFKVVGHRPVVPAAADFVHKAREDGFALQGVGDFGVKLYAVVAARFVRHGGDGAGIRLGNDPETVRQRRDLVAVAHPDFQQAVTFRAAGVFNVFEQTAVTTGADAGMAEFAFVGCADLTAQLAGKGLHSVADAENGHAKLENDFGRAPLRGVVGGIGSAREDDAGGLEGADEVVVDVEGDEFAIDLRFAHAAGDELADLRAEVENEDFAGGAVHHIPGLI